VYDVRVVEQLKDFGKLGARKFSDEMWQEYQKYKAKIDAVTPPMSLRDKDRYLWGKSVYEQALREVGASP
jgi:hypothetical protein